MFLIYLELYISWNVPKVVVGGGGYFFFPNVKSHLVIPPNHDYDRSCSVEEKKYTKISLSCSNKQWRLLNFIKRSNYFSS